MGYFGRLVAERPADMTTMVGLEAKEPPPTKNPTPAVADPEARERPPMKMRKLGGQH